MKTDTFKAALVESEAQMEEVKGFIEEVSAFDSVDASADFSVGSGSQAAHKEKQSYMSTVS